MYCLALVPMRAANLLRGEWSRRVPHLPSFAFASASPSGTYPQLAAHGCWRAVEACYVWHSRMCGGYSGHSDDEHVDH